MADQRNPYFYIRKRCFWCCKAISAGQLSDRTAEWWKAAVCKPCGVLMDQGLGYVEMLKKVHPNHITNPWTSMCPQCSLRDCPEGSDVHYGYYQYAGGDGCRRDCGYTYPEAKRPR